MSAYKLFEAEYNLMDIIWAHEPINSTELVKKAEETLGWKKSTTYTVLRKLVHKGFLRNEEATVSALISREEALYAESKDFLDRFFQGSLPSFLASFTGEGSFRRKSLPKYEK